LPKTPIARNKNAKKNHSGENNMIKSKFIIATVGAAAVLLANVNAAVVDLSTSNSGTINGAVFEFMTQQPTGTGVINPFLRIHGTGNAGTEQGYNTSGRPTAFDEIKDPNFTRNIQFSDLQQTTIALNGTTYFRILLDVNEPNGNRSLITLDALQLYTSATGSQTTSNVASLGTLRYDLDAGGNNSVVIDAARNHGSGSGDVYIYIPTANFAGTADSDFVYLYARFGDADGDDAQGGFEEFALVNNITPIPELSSFFPIIGLMVAVFATNVLRRRKLAQQTAAV
jgi:hypothetical protein